ncbi:polyphosphate kinase 1 [Sedimenticola hydrogenitrophicus]|uniref:polyphosphate kinase 1 n=1 Tax=Sedimenticola hydrogenitrophicus TaxID=2967975 RepID=UPI0023B1FAD6|nr:polyphosphate kinase 1 [Sedimenticola hydrogenitrophicus]
MSDSAKKMVTESAKPLQPVSEAESPTQEKIPLDLDSSEFYLNRELTWLEFNKRVLHEAADERTPLLERLKFIAIVSSNMDEFFMKRLGGLKQQVGAGVTTLTVDGRTPQQQIDESSRVVREIEAQMRENYLAVTALLRDYDIAILSYDELDKSDRGYLRNYYYENIYPLVTPQSIDPAHPFPFISNLSLNLLVLVRYPGDSNKTSLTRIKVPVGAGIPRFLKLKNRRHYVPLEYVIANNLDMLLPEMEVLSCEVFRVTRNANTERSEEHADDLLSLIESELRERRFAPIVRLQVQKDMAPVHRGMLAAELFLDEENDVYEIISMPAMRDLFELASLDVPELRDPTHKPIDHPELVDSRNIFHIIRERGPLLLQHPYESFGTSVERFLKEASIDPKVRAIKMTLYRTSSDTKVVEYLISAARNGKQVAVVVELKARFDEAANIRWANRMEEAGIHVTYGVVGLKTHSKIILVVRNDYSGIKRYLHIGTGNYHAGTARLYSDLGLLTNDEALGRDATELFNYLTTGYTQERSYQKLLPSPKMLKYALLAKIKRERKLHSSETPGLIQFKMNALEDVDITRALYEAARDGVRIDLIVRDTCRFRPGIPGLSETARVIGIVGRFLEHTRIYYFQNGGEEEYFIGSADAMKRNLESRVEVVTPVTEKKLCDELRLILDTQINDQRSAWEMQPDGSFIQRQPSTDVEAVGCQQLLIQSAEKRAKQAAKLIKGKKKKHHLRRNLI